MFTRSPVLPAGGVTLAFLLALAAAPHAQPAGNRPADGTAWLDPYREPAARLIGESLATRFAWERLALIGDTFGNRLSGSKALEDAIAWAVAEMKKDGLENVHREPVKVPHWVRGQESAEIVAPAQHAMVMLGLGNSVGTPPEGVEAEVLVVRSFQELDAAGQPRARQDRPLQRAVHELRRDGAVPLRGSVTRRGARRGRGAGPRRRPARPAHAPHRCAPLRRGTAADPGRCASRWRTPSACSACRTAARRRASG